MFKKIRLLGRKLQAKYENIISSQSLFGFSDAYSKAMDDIKKREQRGAK